MAILPLRKYPDRCLVSVSQPVNKLSQDEIKLLNDMVETMYATKGIGLAAPQVGINKRMAVVDAGSGLLKLINPEIIKKKGEREVSEGCLSIPGYMGQLNRAETVTAKWRDLSGKEVRVKAEGLLAQALEHEVDHLNGQLYVDHMESTEYLQKMEADDLEI